MIELQALNYVIQKKDASFFLMNSLNEDFFTSYKAEYKFINDVLGTNISNDDIVNSITTNFITPALIVKKLSNKKSLFIINLSTGASKRAIQNWSLYCSTKAGIEMFFNVIADDEHKNIEVVNFDPGVMNTNMQQQIRNSKFNDVDVFKSYKSKNILKDTKDVAFEIYERYIKEKIINE